jgi:hypothetical protein
VATWQFTIYLIPRTSLLNKYGEIPLQLQIDYENWSNYIQNSDLDNEPEFEDALTVHWWLDINLFTDKFLPLLKPFGDLEQWTEKAEGLRKFGDSDTNDVTICFDSNTNQIQDLSCRLDLRQLENLFIDNVLNLANHFDCKLMDKQGRLFEANRYALLKAIKLSNAYRFVNGPEQFLDDLSKGIINPE